jgi:hypothetical protein
MGGGPSVVWTEVTGPVFLSLTPKTEHNAVNSEDNVVFSCVYQKDAAGKILFSGKERSAGKWLEKGSSFEVEALFNSRKLLWRTALSDGKVRLGVSLEKGAQAFANLPIPTQKGVEIFEEGGKFILKRDGKPAVAIEAPAGAFLTKPLESYGASQSVRCLRFPLDPAGAESLVTVSPAK